MKRIPKVPLKWSDAGFATGPSGTDYAVWVESYAGRHGDRTFSIHTGKPGKWLLLPDSHRTTERGAKLVAERHEATLTKRRR